MNKTRRKWIENIIKKLKTLNREIEDITTEELIAFDDLPIGLQETERGNTMYKNINDLEDASSKIEDIIDRLNDIIKR